ncbi:MAG: hypothetical protein AAFV53_30895 [Myxococcota bacterium]
MVMMFLALFAAHAAKIPVIVNVGIGPTIGVVGGAGQFSAPSLGLALQAEGWVSKKTLRKKKVRRRIPKQYRGMVRDMPDLHVRPLPTLLIPDAVFIGPVQDEGAALRGASWSPISMALVHQGRAKGPHVSVSVAPRIAWLNLSGAGGGDAINQGWLGASIDPEVQTNQRERVGFALTGSVGAGWTPDVSDANIGLDGRPWLMISGGARLQLRFPMKIDI